MKFNHTDEKRIWDRCKHFWYWEPEFKKALHSFVYRIYKSFGKYYLSWCINLNIFTTAV